VLAHESSLCPIHPEAVACWLGSPSRLESRRSGHTGICLRAARGSLAKHTHSALAQQSTRHATARELVAELSSVSGFRFPVSASRFLAGEREGVTRLGARDTRNENAHGIDTIRDAYSSTRNKNGGTIRRVYVRNRTARARRLPPPTGWPRSRAEPTERPRSCPIAVGRCYVRQAASE